MRDDKRNRKWICAMVRSVGLGISAALGFVWLTGSEGLSDTQLMVGNVRGAPGSTVSVPIQFASDTTVVAAQFDLVYEATSVSAGTAAGGSAVVGHSVKSSEASAGVRRVVVYSLENAQFQNGVLVTIPLSISSNAPEGVVGLTLA